MKTNHNYLQRTLFMLIGNLLIGLAVTTYRLSGLGVDAFTGMNLGISGFLNLTFGTWQLLINIVLLVIVFFTARSLIGPGTIVNMVGIGYIADFLCWLVLDVAKLNITLPLRIFFLLLGTLFASLGVALYMHADMGLSPYDSVAPIIVKLSNEKIAFQTARVSSDIISLTLGILFCLAAHDNIWMIVGIGTIMNALLNGPLIQFFKNRLSGEK